MGKTQVDQGQPLQPLRRAWQEKPDHSAGKQAFPPQKGSPSRATTWRDSPACPGRQPQGRQTWGTVDTSVQVTHSHTNQDTNQDTDTQTHTETHTWTHNRRYTRAATKASHRPTQGHARGYGHTHPLTHKQLPRDSNSPGCAIRDSKYQTPRGHGSHTSHTVTQADLERDTRHSKQRHKVQENTTKGSQAPSLKPPKIHQPLVGTQALVGA